MRRGRKHGLGGFGRLTKAKIVGPCKSDRTRCCVVTRTNATDILPGIVPGKDEFKQLCNKEKLRVEIGKKRRVPEGTTTLSPEATEGLEGTMARRKKHLARHVAGLAEYGEPFGDVGILDDLADTADLKGAAWIAGSGAATLFAGPKLLALIPNQIMGKNIGQWARAAAAIAGGFAAFKWGRKWRHDVAVGSGAVLMGLGITTALKQFAFMKDLMKDTMSLGAALPEEAALMDALNAIEDEPLAQDWEPAISQGEDWDGLGAWYDNTGLQAQITEPAALDAWYDEDIDSGDVELENPELGSYEELGAFWDDGINADIDEQEPGFAMLF